MFYSSYRGTIYITRLPLYASLLLVPYSYLNSDFRQRIEELTNKLDLGDEQGDHHEEGRAAPPMPADTGDEGTTRAATVITIVYIYSDIVI